MIVSIDNRQLGESFPPYIIAEISANHNGSLDRALETIAMAKACGADAVKIQTYTADTMTIDCDKEDFMIKGGLWGGYRLYDLYQEAHTPYEWHKTIFEFARKVGITLFSSPFDESAVDLLEELGTPAYKIASFEIVDLPLIKYVAETGKPIIISTGMADLDEIEEAVTVARDNGCGSIILLHCISSYPAPIEQSNLRIIPDLANRLGVLVGLSDHTVGTTAAIAGIALGACVIEKHVTLSRKDKGPDSAFSLEPEELKNLTEQSRDTWLALGKAGYGCTPAEQSNFKFRRSVYAVKDIDSGEVFTEENIKRIRPGYGLKPGYYYDVIGKKAAFDLKRGEALLWKHVGEE